MEKPRKTRKSTPKTKTGCITCKLRRVKCGEERPFCQRCIKFGVSCDGYPTRSTHGKAAKAAFPVKIAPRAVTTSYSTNEEEHQYFTLFCSSTSLEILPGFDSGSTRQALLQLCHFKSSIRHAIIAIGALEKTYSVTPNLSRLSLDDREWATKANKHHKAALKQYSEAISHMSKDVSSHQNSLRTTLLACLLILCFEAWNGNLKLAVGQVRAGIALILEWKAAHGGLNDARLSSEPGIIEADLIQIFCRLAIQSIFFGFELTAPSRSLLGAEGRSLVRSMPTAFVDLSHAATYQQSLIRRGTYLFGAHVRTYPSFVNHTILPELFAAQVEFRADSLKWLQAFDPLFTSAPPGRRSPCVERKSDADHAWGILWSKPLTSCARYSLQFARMMKLQVLISYAYASTAFSTNDDAHEEYRDCWNVGVRLAEEVLTDKYWAKDDKPANYCFDSRVVMPLWMAGIHCRDDMRRNKVIELLLKFPRREGIWDSIWAGKMLQWVAGLERCFRGLDGHIPEWARIRDLKWTSDFEKRSSLLSCRQRISSSSLDVEEKTTRVLW